MKLRFQTPGLTAGADMGGMAFPARRIGVFLCALLAAGSTLMSCRKTGPAAAPQPPEVRVMTVAKRDFPIYQEWLGTLTGLVNTQVRARVTGYLVAQNYREGTFVKEGQLLFTIDPRPLEAALAQARGDLTRAEAAEKLACANDVRAQALFRTGVISAQERDQATANYGTARGDTQAQKGAVETACLNVEFARITAPVSGIAGAATAQVGDLVGPNTTGTNPLTTVSVLDPIKAEFTLTEQEYLGFVRRQKQAVKGGGGSVATMDRDLDSVALEMILADGWVYPEKGRFDFAERYVDSTTGSMRVYALFPNPGSRLRPGLFCRVRARVDVLRGMAAVPLRAVSDVQGKATVIVVTPEGKAAFRPVELGETDGSWRAVRKGLQPGERVIVDGLQKARDGQPVDAKEDAEKEGKSST